jgi:hypothetical protein
MPPCASGRRNRLKTGVARFFAIAFCRIAINLNETKILVVKKIGNAEGRKQGERAIEQNRMNTGNSVTVSAFARLNGRARDDADIDVICGIAGVTRAAMPSASDDVPQRHNKSIGKGRENT